MTCQHERLQLLNRKHYRCRDCGAGLVRVSGNVGSLGGVRSRGALARARGAKR